MSNKFHMMITLLLTKSIFLCYVNCEEYCYQTNPDSFSSWGSKQTYAAVRGRNALPPDNLANCEVSHFWSLHRHGTRYPKPNEAEQMKKLLVPLREEIRASERTELCDDDKRAIIDWEFNEDLITRANNLTNVGWKESYFTGQRFRKNFLKDDRNIYLRSTVDSWTRDSLIALYLGLITTSTDGSVYHIDESREEDLVLAPYDNCNAWDEYQNDKASVQPKAFLQSDIFLSLIDRVGKRLGVSSLTSDSIISMWEICRLYRVAFPGQPSPWCAAFSHQDFIILEYHDDMFQYYFAGYGSKLNVQLGCHPLMNLIENFRSSISDGDNKSTMYVAHLTITQMVMSALGIGKDSLVLNSDNANVLMYDRNYRTNYLQPYGVNIAAVLYRCHGDNYYVQLYHNEKLLRLCDGEFCSWLEFSDIFKKYENCNFSYCNNDTK